jgi:hypothetical protein
MGKFGDKIKIIHRSRHSCQGKFSPDFKTIEFSNLRRLTRNLLDARLRRALI